MKILWDAIDISWNTFRSDGGRGIPLLFWGSPGIGKSAIISQIAEKLKVRLETVVLSVRDPSDVCGLPVRTKTGVRLHEPIWAKNLIDHDGGILFFDELNCAPPSVQAAALRIVCERVVGEVTLPKNTLIVAACNPPEEGANTTDLEPPLANRFCHLDASPDIELFNDYLVFGKTRAPNTKPVDPEDWAARYSEITAVVSKFLTRNRNMLQGKADEKIFASPRSWEMACRLWATSRCRNTSSIPFVQGCIGEGTSKELFEFFSKMNLPDPRSVIRDGKKVLPKKVDELYTTIISTLSFVLKYQANVPRFCEVLGELEAEDIIAHCAKELILNGLCDSKQAITLISKLDI